MSRENEKSDGDLNRFRVASLEDPLYLRGIVSPHRPQYLYGGEDFSTKACRGSCPWIPLEKPLETHKNPASIIFSGTSFFSPPPHSLTHTHTLSLSLSPLSFSLLLCLSRFISSGRVSSERTSRKKDARSGPLCQLVTWVAEDARENERKAPRDQGNGDRSCSHQEVFASSLLHRDISSFYSFLLCVRLNGKDVALGV